MTTDIARFHWADYLMFALTLAISAAIGIFSAIWDKRKRGHMTSDELLLAGRNLRVLPVAMSLFVTFMSPVGIMGTPSEVYSFGGQHMLRIFGLLLVTPLTTYVMIPMYHKLHLTSAYEYLEMRFNKTVRLLVSIAFIPQMLFYMAAVLYTPALGLSQVTGLPIWVSVVVGGLVCTFYTSVGGLRAVVWTDLFQSIIMLLGLIVIFVFGIIEVGGLGNVLHIAKQGGRMPYFNFDPDPFVRLSFWTVFSGGIFATLSTEGCNQALIQRYLSLEKLRDAQIASWVKKFCAIFYIVMQCFCGLIVYAYYHDCDPLLNGRISKRDQIFPLFVMDILQSLPGIPGLFLSCILSAALSTVSSGLNSIATVALKDMVQPFYFRVRGEKMGDALAVKYVIGIGAVMGLASIGLALLFKEFDQIVLQICNSTWSMVGGAIIGVTFLAMFFPCANSWGAIAGFITGTVIVTWIAIGAIVSPPPVSYLLTSDEGCNVTNSIYNSSGSNYDAYNRYNIVSQSTTVRMWEPTVDPISESDSEGISYIYRLSFWHYYPLGTIVCILTALVVSAATGFNKSNPVPGHLVYPLWERMCCCCRSHCGKYRKESRFSREENGDTTMSLLNEK